MLANRAVRAWSCRFWGRFSPVARLADRVSGRNHAQGSRPELGLDPSLDRLDQIASFQSSVSVHRPGSRFTSRRRWPAEFTLEFLRSSRDQNIVIESAIIGFVALSRCLLELLSVGDIDFVEWGYFWLQCGEWPLGGKKKIEATLSTLIVSSSMMC